MMIEGFQIFMIEIGTPLPGKDCPPWLYDAIDQYFIATKDGVEIRANSMKYLKVKIKKHCAKQLAK